MNVQHAYLVSEMISKRIQYRQMTLNVYYKVVDNSTLDNDGSKGVTYCTLGLTVGLMYRRTTLTVCIPVGQCVCSNHTPG